MKKISINMIFNVSYNLLNILFPFITSVYLARVLGPEYLGRITYAQNIMQYFLIFASLGIPTYGMRQISRCNGNKERISRVFTELFKINAFTSIFCSILFTITVFVIGDFSTDIKLYLCVGLTLYMNIINIDWFYTGKEDYVYITVRSFVVKVISIIAIFVFVHTQQDYVIYALITSMATTGNYIFNIINLRDKVKFCRKNIDVKKHIRPTLILFVVLFFSNIYNQIDITMIGMIKDKVAVGHYSNPVKIVRIVTSLTTTLSATILPQMCSLYKERNLNRFNELYNKTFKLVYLLAMCIGCGICLVGDNLVYVLWGTEFAPSVSVLVILAFIVPIIAVSYISGSVILMATDNEKKLLLATSCGAGMNIVGNAFLIPYWGIEGAAIVSVLSETVVLLVHIFFSKKYIKLRIDKRFVASTMIPIAVMFIVVKVIGNLLQLSCIIKLMSQVVIGAFLCILCMLIMKNEVLYDLLGRVIQYIKKE